MKRFVIGSISTLVAGAGLAFAEPAPGPATPDGAPGLAAPSEAAKPAAPAHAAPADPGVLPPAGPGCGACDAPAKKKWHFLPSYKSKCEPKCDSGKCPTPCADKCPDDDDCLKLERKHRLGKEVWFSTEYILWWIKDAPMAPLLTTNLNPETLAENPGIVGVPGTAVLFGGDNLEFDPFSGFRANAGIMLTETWSIESSGFSLQKKSLGIAALSDPTGLPNFTRPTIGAETGAEEAIFLVSFPGAFAGGIVIDTSTRLWGVEANVAKNLGRGDVFGIDVLGGYRFLGLDEDLTIADSSRVLEGGAGFFLGELITEGGYLAKTDVFDVSNNMHLVQLGARAELSLGKVYILAKARVGLGVNHEVLEINGSSSVLRPDGTTATTPGGLLAVSSNMGRHTNDEFVVVPEVGVNVGFNVTDRLRLFAGYNFLYISDVLRPGEQVNRVINPSLVPTNQLFGTNNTLQFPFPSLKSTDFWAHGLNAGIAFRF
jgi:hypothetical protein